MILGAAFLVNLLCGFYNCDYLHNEPVSNELERGQMSQRTNRMVKNEFPTILTKSGLVEGYFMTVFNGRTIAAFEGIPYAEPPTGPNRFKAPVPVSPWTYVKSAKVPGMDCLQLNLVRLARVVGHEDCLTLNIYTPSLPTVQNSSLSYPIIIFIHGGNFYMGAGREYGPSYLLQKDVILVTINYRLGVLGFLNSGDTSSPGNYGLKDQALAIKWVYDNAEVIGGDPGRITIMGQSAGAASVHLQMLATSSVAHGRFSRAISLSGSGFHHWALQETPEAVKWSSKLGRLLGCHGHGEDLVNCLRSRDPNFLVSNQWNLFEMFIFPAVLFAPSIEPNGTGSFITQTAEESYAKGQVARIPWLCTNTKDETEYIIMAIKNMLLLPYYMNHWGEVAPLVLDLKGKMEDAEGMSQTLSDYYLQTREVYRVDPRKVSELGTDRYFSVPNRLALRKHFEIAPTYSYMFEFKSRVGVANSLFNDHRQWGAPHGEDLSVIFNSTLYFLPIKKGEPASQISDFMVNILANFARLGQPLYTDERGIEMVVWDAIKNPKDLRFLRIGLYGDIQMISEPFKERLKIWRQLGFK